MSPYRFIAQYCIPVPPIGEPDAEYQLEIVYTWAPRKESFQPTKDEVIEKMDRDPMAAIYAFYTYN